MMMMNNRVVLHVVVVVSAASVLLCWWPLVRAAAVPPGAVGGEALVRLKHYNACVRRTGGRDAGHSCRLVSATAVVTAHPLSSRARLHDERRTGQHRSLLSDRPYRGRIHDVCVQGGVQRYRLAKVAREAADLQRVRALDPQLKPASL